MSASNDRVSTRPLEQRQATKAVTEELADGRRIGLDDGRVGSELWRQAVRKRKYRWQLDVAGP